MNKPTREISLLTHYTNYIKYINRAKKIDQVRNIYEGF